MPDPDSHQDDTAEPSVGEPPKPAPGGLTLRSPAFRDHTVIPGRHSYGGGNLSPPLEWSATPEGTEELALICEDPDAPGGTFVHWVITNISPQSSGMDEGALPPGAVAGRNSFGELGWGGPQPPIGDQAHRYQFRIYAADRPLALGEGASADDVRAMLSDRSLNQATLVGLFSR